MTYEPEIHQFTPIQVHYKFRKSVYYFQVLLIYKVFCLKNIYYEQEILDEFYNYPFSDNECNAYKATGGGYNLLLHQLPKGDCYAEAKIRYRITPNSPLDSCGFSVLSFHWHGNGVECF